MLENFALDADVDTTSSDSVGGFAPFESNVLSMNLVMAYLDFAASKAASVNLIFKDANDKELRITEYITSGEAKGCKPYYIHKKTGKKVALPGYSKINDLCLVVTGKNFAEQTAEEKTINVWDKEAKAELPKPRKVIMTLLKQKVKVGVLLVKADKTENVAAMGEKADYQPTGETRELNEADNFFNIDTDFTGAEMKAKATEAKFIKTWLKKWEGQVKDTSTKTATKQGAPVGTSTASLFPTA